MEQEIGSSCIMFQTVWRNKIPPTSKGTCPQYDAHIVQYNIDHTDVIISDLPIVLSMDHTSRFIRYHSDWIE